MANKQIILALAVAVLLPMIVYGAASDEGWFGCSFGDKILHLGIQILHLGTKFFIWEWNSSFGNKIVQIVGRSSNCIKWRKAGREFFSNS